MTVERVEASEQEQDESGELQGENSDRPAGRGSPRLYMKRLHDELKKYGIDLHKLPKLTHAGQEPPCFEMADTSYEEWLKAASVDNHTMPPIRLDMPGEPNYCADCTVAFRGRAIAAGKCQFPNVIFEGRKDWLTKEVEIVGVSRSARVEASEIEDDRALLLGDMKIPEEAATRELVKALSARREGGRVVTIRQWRDIPLKARITLSFPWGATEGESE